MRSFGAIAVTVLLIGGAASSNFARISPIHAMSVFRQR
jgi:hypothetical protein